MTGLYNVGRRYLSRQLNISSGGVPGIIINNLEYRNGVVVTSRIRSFSLWSSYVKEFLLNVTRLEPVQQNGTFQMNSFTEVQNPNRISAILMIVWLITFLLMIFMLYLLTELRHRKDKREKNQLRDFRFLLPRARRRSMCRSRIKRCMVLITMICTMTIWLIFMALLCLSQYIMSSKLADNPESTNGTQSSGTISSAVNVSFKYLYNFFDIITNKTGIFLATSVSTLTMNVQNNLNTSIVGFGNEILQTFNVTGLFNTAAMLLVSINGVINSMTYINNNCQDILSDIINVNGSVSLYQQNLDLYLSRICRALNNSKELQYSCQLLEIKNQLFKTSINTNLVDSSSSNFMVNLLQQYHINITDITNNFNRIDNQFKMNLNSMFNATINQINITSYFAFVTNIWTDLVNQLLPSIIATKSYNTVFNSALDSVSKYENLVTIILIFLIFVAILMILLFSFRDSIHGKTVNRFIQFGIQCAFLLVLLISAMFCIIVLTLSNINQSEICNQIISTNSVRVLDNMINDKLAMPWNTTIAPALSSYKNINISVTQPTNIISGIKDRCRNTSIGLFGVMGMGKFVNVTQIIRSQSILSIIKAAENTSLNAFLNVHPENIIPQDLTNFISKTITLIAYFDALNYSVDINELQKPLVGVIDFAGFFRDLSSLAKNSSEYLGWTNDTTSLNNTANDLLRMVHNWTDIQNRVNNLTANFQTLQNNRNNSFFMNQLMTMISNLKSLFNNSSQIVSMFSSLYNNLIVINMLDNVDHVITGSFSVIVSQMIQCADLSKIYEAITTTFCSVTDFNVSLASFGMMLFIETITCQIVSILVMVSSCLRLNYEENVSKC